MINNNRFTFSRKIIWAIIVSIIGSIGSLSVGSIFFNITKDNLTPVALIIMTSGALTAFRLEKEDPLVFKVLLSIFGAVSCLTGTFLFSLIL